MKSFIKNILSILKGAKFIESIQNGLLIWYLLNGLVVSILPFISIYMSSLIITGLSTGVNLNTLIVYVVTTICITFILTLVNALSTQMIEVKNNEFQKRIELAKARKMSEIDYSLIEDTNTHKMLRTIEEIDNFRGGTYRYFQKLPLLIQGLCSVIFASILTWEVFITTGYSGSGYIMSFVCSPISSILVLFFIVISVIIYMWSGKGTIKASHSYSKKTRSFNSKIIYLCQQYLFSYQAGKDVRVYNQINMISNELLNMTEQKNKVNLEYTNQVVYYTSFNFISSGILSAIIYLYVGIKALSGLFSIGLVVRYIGGVFQFSQGLNNFLGAYSELKANVPLMQSYYDFFDLPSVMHTGTDTIDLDSDEHTIEFKNVSFKYPGSEIYVVKNLSFKLENGKRYAIVGMNGSGKTTMIKLLCRLYDPQEGHILLDDKDIRQYDYNNYLDFFSVVFQDFKLFSMELAQNIAANYRYNEEKVKSALTKSGLEERFKSFKNSFDTVLYKDFDNDGVEISGGEAQKIALARAVYKDSPYVILDEPTAALDPIAEQEIYNKFDQIIDGKNAIYVSHRLSSCRFCDEIIVFHKGEIVQMGSHENLVNKDGIYKELWQAQSQYYIKNFI